MGEDLAQGFDVHLGVDGGSFKRGVAEENLDGADVGTASLHLHAPSRERWLPDTEIAETLPNLQLPGLSHYVNTELFQSGVLTPERV